MLKAKSKERDKDQDKDQDLSSSASKERTSTSEVDPQLEALECPQLARLMTVLELRDHHSLDKEMFKKPVIESELEQAKSIVNDEFVGILAKCKISGCDVHALNSALEIHKHYRADESIEDDFLSARPLAAVLPEAIIAVLVFKKHISYLYQNGKVEVIE